MTNEVATTLWDLKVAGLEMKDMGGAHTSAEGTVGGVDPTSALQRPAEIGLGATGFSHAFTSARDAVTAMLTANASSLNDSGQALIWCAEVNYAQADQDVRSTFDALNQADTDHD